MTVVQGLAVQAAAEASREQLMTVVQGLAVQAAAEASREQLCGVADQMMACLALGED